MAILTDRDALTTTATGDILHIVDVSDTTDDAGGTSKKITFANLVARVLTELGVTSSVAELNILDGVTADATEINLLDGLTVLSGSNTGDEPAADLTTPGIIEIATAAETTTGSDATRAVSPDGLAGSDFGKRVVTLIVLDNATDNAVADGQGSFTWTVPQEFNGWNIVDAHASVEVAGVTGTQDVQLHNVTSAADILSTKITIDTTELTSYTAATPPVVDAAEDDLATGDKIRIDTDVIHSGTAAKGLQVILTLQKP